MASKVTGKQTATMVEEGTDFDPATGQIFYQTWRGSKAEIIAKAGELITAGWSISRRKAGGAVYEVHATISGYLPGGSTEVPVDRWRIGTELALMDVLTNPKLIASAGGEATLNTWVKQIEEALGASEAEDAAWSTTQKELYRLIARGELTYEVKRCVLTRVRSVSLNYSGQFLMEASPIVYSTPTLVSAFGIPAAIAARLPAAPSLKPSDTTWAWCWRQQDSDTLLAWNRVEEVDSWVFRPWPNSLYQFL